MRLTKVKNFSGEYLALNFSNWRVNMKLVNIILVVAFMAATSVKVKAAINEEISPKAYMIAQSWLKALDNNRPNELETMISIEMKKVLPSEEIIETLTKRRSQLGVLEKRTLLKSETHSAIYNFPKAQYIVFTFKSDYSLQKGVTHLVRVIKENEGWLIISDLQL